MNGAVGQKVFFVGSMALKSITIYKCHVSLVTLHSRSHRYSQGGRSKIAYRGPGTFYELLTDAQAATR